MPLDKEHKCIYKVNADVKCEYSNCKSCPHCPDKVNKN